MTTCDKADWNKQCPNIPFEDVPFGDTSCESGRSALSASTWCLQSCHKDADCVRSDLFCDMTPEDLALNMSDLKYLQKRGRGALRNRVTVPDSGG